MQDYEKIWKEFIQHHIKYLFKLAGDAVKDADISDEEKTIETLLRQYIQMIKSVMNVADETQVKNLKKLSDVVDDAFKFGVIAGVCSLFELLKESDEQIKKLFELLKENEEQIKKLYELVIKLLKENEELRRRMSETSVFFYIR